MIQERAKQVQKDIYLCCIDYKKTFDKVRHNELFERLGKLDLFEKAIRINLRLF